MSQQEPLPKQKMLSRNPASEQSMTQNISNEASQTASSNKESKPQKHTIKRPKTMEAIAISTKDASLLQRMKKSKSGKTELSIT